MFGFDPKIMRKVVSLRKMDQADRQEMESLLDVYMHAIEGGDAVRPTAEVVAINE